MQTPDAETIDPLLAPLSDSQQLLVTVIGQVLQDTGDWPVFDYVEWQLDHHGLDANTVITSLPSMTSGPFRYSLVHGDPSRGSQLRSDDRTVLTAAGLSRLPLSLAGVRDLSTQYLRALAELVEHYVAWPREPHQVAEPQIALPELLGVLGQPEVPYLSVTAGLLQSEPGTVHGFVQQQGVSPLGWTFKTSNFSRRFRGVTDMADYLARVRAWRVPPAPTPVPSAPSPLTLAAELDFLDAVWRNRFSSVLVRLPSAERVARLSVSVQSAAEFDSHASALREILKGFDVPGLSGGASRLAEFLRTALPAESMPTVEDAVATLKAVTALRNAGQHIEALPDALSKFARLGLAYPIYNPAQAWESVTAYVCDALRILREEIQVNSP